jgi:hypothetical protein
MQKKIKRLSTQYLTAFLSEARGDLDRVRWLRVYR